VVSQWARATGIEPLLDRRPAELSGGQRQRTAMARALALDPEALLLDEPFSALDPHLRRQMEAQLRETLRHYRGPVVFVTHDRGEAYRLCEKLVVLDLGSIAAAGPREEVFQRPASLAAARLTGCRNLAPMVVVDADHIRVDEWSCTLRVASPIPAGS